MVVVVVLRLDGVLWMLSASKCIYVCIVGRFEELERRKNVVRDEAKLGSGWLSSSTPPAARVTAPPHGSPFDLQLAELQRLYSAAVAGAGSLGSFPPSWCHPQNMAAELLQRERLEQLGNVEYL